MDSIGGAKIEMIMAKALPAAMDKLKLHEVLSTQQLKMIIANLSGLEGRIFDTDQTWRTLVIHSINKFEKLCLDTVDKVRDEVRGIVKLVVLPTLKPFPGLERAIEAAVEEMVVEAHEPTRQLVDDIVAMEKMRLNVSHPDFIGHESNRQAA